MDPHYMLVIFLPALLFESAAFGLDMVRCPEPRPHAALPWRSPLLRRGALRRHPLRARLPAAQGIFRKQIWQILLLAFPAMVVASALTGAILYAHSEVMALGWTFWHCW